jgi:hypothetical protein
MECLSKFDQLASPKGYAEMKGNETFPVLVPIAPSRPQQATEQVYPQVFGLGTTMAFGEKAWDND